jgi:hypothetical protein
VLVRGAGVATGGVATASGWLRSRLEALRGAGAWARTMGGVQSSTSSIPQMPNRIENGTNRPATARGRADSISGADMVSVSKTCHAPLGRQGLLNRSLMCFFMLRGSCRGCGF